MAENPVVLSINPLQKPTAPKLPQSELEVIDSKAQEIVGALQVGNQDRSFLNSVMNIGAEAQQRAARKLELLKGRVGTLMGELDGEGAQIPKDLVQMRLVLDKINPHVMQKSGFFSRLLGKVPGVGDRLKAIAINYESVQTQIDTIVASLRNGKDELLKDNMSLEQLYDDLQQEQLGVQKNAYLGELLLAKLDDMGNQVTDPVAAQKIDTVKHAVALRVQDLRTMEQVNMQFFLSIDMTCENNRLLAQTVDRTLSITTNVITVGLAIAAALARQKSTLEATRATQEYAGQILASNAAAIKQQTTDIQTLYKDPVLGLQYLQKGYDDLISALEEVEKAKKGGIDAARAGIAQVTAMSQKLAGRLEGVRPSSLPEAEATKSIEA